MKFLPKTLAECRTLYEQLLYVANKYDWPYSAAHEAASMAVFDNGSNEKISNSVDLWHIAKDAFRIN